MIPNIFKTMMTAMGTPKIHNKAILPSPIKILLLKRLYSFAAYLQLQNLPSFILMLFEINKIKNLN
jgi:hypothetical protein